MDNSSLFNFALGHDEESGTGTLWLKIGSVVVIFGFGLAFGLMPFFM